MSNIILIITIAVFVLFALLFLARVLFKKHLFKDLSTSTSNQAFNFNEMLKMAYPALLIYAVFYAIFLIVVFIHYSGEGSLEAMRAAIESPDKGLNAVEWIPMLIGIFLDFWLALHIFDMEFRSRNKPFLLYFNTVSTNTGVAKWNITLIILSLSTLIASFVLMAKDHIFYICMPLFLAATIAMIVNLFVGQDEDWKVKKPSKIKWTPSGNDGDVRIKAGSDSDNNKTPVERKFGWNLKDKWGIDADASDAVTVKLYKEDWDEPEPELRKQNPFYGDADGNAFHKWVYAAGDNLEASAQIVVKGPDSDSNDSEQQALEAILQSASDIADKYGLAEFEIPELLLTFSQSDQIRYVVDQESAAIKRFNETDSNGDPILEYFRFASETLYDSEGDCDCKSVLAYRLMNTLGIDVKLVSVCTGGSKTPTHVAIIFKDDTNRYKKLDKYPGYTYCEATSKGWKIGVVPDDVDESSIKILV